MKWGPGRPLRSLRLPQGLHKSWKVGPGSRLSRGRPLALVLSSPPARLEPHPPTQPRPQAQRPLSSEASFRVSQVRMKRTGKAAPRGSEVLGHQHPGAQWGSLAEAGDTAREALPLTCPVLSRSQGSVLRTADRASPAFIKHQEDAQGTAPTTLHYNSSSGTVSPIRPSDFLFPGSSTVTAQRTPDDAWQMSKRAEGWSQMCL